MLESDLNLLSMLLALIADVSLVLLLFTYWIRRQEFATPGYEGWSRSNFQRSFLLLSLIAAICFFIALLTVNPQNEIPYVKSMEQALEQAGYWRLFNGAGVIANTIAFPIFLQAFFRKNPQRQNRKIPAI